MYVYGRGHSHLHVYARMLSHVLLCTSSCVELMRAHSCSLSHVHAYAACTAINGRVTNTTERPTFNKQTYGDGRDTPS